MKNIIKRIVLVVVLVAIGHCLVAAVEFMGVKTILDNPNDNQKGDVVKVVSVDGIEGMQGTITIYKPTETSIIDRNMDFDDAIEDIPITEESKEVKQIYIPDLPEVNP